MLLLYATLVQLLNSKVDDWQSKFNSQLDPGYLLG